MNCSEKIKMYKAYALELKELFKLNGGRLPGYGDVLDDGSKALEVIRQIKEESANNASIKKIYNDLLECKKEAKAQARLFLKGNELVEHSALKYLDEFIKYFISCNCMIPKDDETIIGNSKACNYYRSLKTYKKSLENDALECKNIPTKLEIINRKLEIIQNAIDYIDQVEMDFAIHNNEINTSLVLKYLELHGGNIEATSEIVVDGKTALKYYESEKAATYVISKKAEPTEYEQERLMNFNKIYEVVDYYRNVEEIKLRNKKTEYYIKYIISNNGWVKENDQTEMNVDGTSCKIGRYFLNETRFYNEVIQKKLANNIALSLAEQNRLENYNRILEVLEHYDSQITAQKKEWRSTNAKKTVEHGEYIDQYLEYLISHDGIIHDDDKSVYFGNCSVGKYRASLIFSYNNAVKNNDVERMEKIKTLLTRIYETQKVCYEKVNYGRPIISIFDKKDNSTKIKKRK